MRIGFLRAALLVFCLGSTPVLIAQITGAASPLAAATTQAPDADSGMYGHVEGLYIPLVTGQPFHAKVAVQIHRQLPDGTVVDQKYYTLVARDGAGREHRESRDPIAADSDLEPPLLRTTVYDPKTSLITTCTPDQGICRETVFDPTQRPVDDPVGPSTDGKSVLAREDLGKKTIDGLEVIGTRETRTFNSGAFGNDKPVVVTKEIWYSPQLQFNLSVTRLDPRSGMQKFDVTDLKLGEPGPEWFAIPDGYRLVQGRGIANHPIWPTELEPLIEKQLPGISPEELTTDLAPVEAAIGANAKAHAAASPNDKTDAFAGQLRNQLSGDLRMLQQGNFSPNTQFQEANLRLNETFREVVESPCLDKPQPGDPPSVPINAESFRAEETAWLGVRDTWDTFLAKLFPKNDPASFSWMLTTNRENELRHLANIERNRGCVPEESIEPLIVSFVTGLTADQLDAALKPVNAAINAYAKAHNDAEPPDQNQDYVREIDQQLASQVRMQQRNRVPTQDDFEEADLHLNQAFRAVISSPCLSKPIPGDPPNAPVSEEKLRAEEQSWIAMRDAWTAFMFAVFPNGNQTAFGTMLTQQRTGELQQIQNIERNRGCIPPE
jgi:uncharacterized protein YecT (DUF1311 family)